MPGFGRPRLRVRQPIARLVVPFGRQIRRPSCVSDRSAGLAGPVPAGLELTLKIVEPISLLETFRRCRGGVGGRGVSIPTPESARTADQPLSRRQLVGEPASRRVVIDKADALIGTVTATKFDGYELRATVTVRPRGETQTLVRANATIDNRAIEEPEPYQDFFVVLEKAMFLTARQID